MAIKTQRRPYKFPSRYVCYYCKAEVKKRDIIAGRAKEIDEVTCICPDCLVRPAKPEPKPQDQIPTVRKPAKPKARIRPVAENETFIVMIAAAEEDMIMRDRILSMAQLDSARREFLIDSLVASLRVNKKTAPLAAALECLKDDNVARRTVEILLKR